MDITESKRIVMDAWRTFASRDLRRIGALFTEDAEWIAPAGNATALALEYTNHMIGRDAIARFIGREFHRLLTSDVSVEFTGVFAEGRTVIVEERMQAALANGRRYDNEYCFVFELATDGRIARVREYMDTQRGRACIFGSEVQSG